jgi:hypothetical protein
MVGTLGLIVRGVMLIQRAVRYTNCSIRPSLFDGLDLSNFLLVLLLCYRYLFFLCPVFSALSLLYKLQVPLPRLPILSFSSRAIGSCFVS